MNQTSPWVKFGVIAGLLLLVVGLLFVIKTQYDISTRQAAIEKSVVEMKQIGDGIVRSQAKYATKDDLEKFGKDLGLNLDLIQKDLDALGADIKGINTILASTPGYHGTGLPSTGTTPGNNPPPTPVPCPPGGTCPNLDPFGYLSNAQILALNEPFGSNVQIPFGETRFKAWKDKPWDLDVYPRNYAVTTVIGQDEDGRHYTYNKFTIETQGKKYDVPIKDSKFVEQYPESAFRFSPSLSLGLDGGVVVNPSPVAELTPNLQVSLFNYGRTKIDPDWTFVGVGVGYQTQNNRPAAVLSPINYNVGHQLPLINNLHVGPTVGIDTAGGISVMAGVRVGL